MAWSRSVPLAAAMPATVPVPEYCQIAQFAQPVGSTGLPVVIDGTHSGSGPNPVLLPVQLSHQVGGV